MGSLFAVCFAFLCVARVSCQEGAQNQDDTQYHNEKAKERVFYFVVSADGAVVSSLFGQNTLRLFIHSHQHLLQHLADRMDLDGEGLRHIKKHLQEVAGDKIDTSDVQDIEAGNNAKGIFYFFQLHDFDNNHKLDGLEWMAALTDYHKDESEKDSFKEGGKIFLQHEAEAIVDELLEKHDKNEDGYIDFYELMKSDVNSFMTDLDKQPEGHGEPSADQQQQQSSLEQEFQQQQQVQESQEETPQQDQPSEQQQQESSSLEQEYEQKQEQQDQ